MGWPKCNSTEEFETLTETPVWHGLTFHRMGIYLCAIFALIAIVVSFYLIMMHATHYLRPWEQRHIIRILFLVPIFAVVSFLSFVYYTRAVYFEFVRDAYEAVAIVAFFTLICAYVAPDLHQQKNYFRSIEPKQWIWPIPWIAKLFRGDNGPFRKPRSGLTWFNVIWVGVFQYTFIQVLSSLISVITEPFNLYCENSMNPAFAHVYVDVLECVGVTIAIYCIIQFYFQLRVDISSHKPLLKLAAIKLVVFLTFWQTILLDLLTSTGLIKATKHLGDQDINNGIPSLLLCIEMALFAVFHLWAFSWRPYRIDSKHTLAEAVPGYSMDVTDYKGGFFGWKALAEALNPWDVLKAVGRSGRWVFVGRRHRMLDSSYNRTRQGTDASATVGLHPLTAQSDTSYQPGKMGGQYGDEDQELLHNAQSNPAGPPPAYNYGHNGSFDHDHSYYHHEDPADIGVARSTYGDDESENRSYDQRSYDDRSRGHSPIPPPLPAGAVSDRIAMPMPSGPGYRRPGPSPNRDATEKDMEEYGGHSRFKPNDPQQPSQSGRDGLQPDEIPGLAVPYPESGSGRQEQEQINMPEPRGPISVDRRYGNT